MNLFKIFKEKYTFNMEDCWRMISEWANQSTWLELEKVSKFLLRSTLKSRRTFLLMASTNMLYSGYNSIEHFCYTHPYLKFIVYGDYAHKSFITRTIKFVYTRGSNNLKVSMLAGVKKLDLTRSNVTDVSMLSNATDLNLSGCVGVTDVSMLSYCSSLNLSGCINVTDVSMLSGVKNLTLDK